jgi:hypothetical protein
VARSAGHSPCAPLGIRPAEIEIEKNHRAAGYVPQGECPAERTNAQRSGAPNLLRIGGNLRTWTVVVLLRFADQHESCRYGEMCLRVVVKPQSGALKRYTGCLKGFTVDFAFKKLSHVIWGVGCIVIVIA